MWKRFSGTLAVVLLMQLSSLPASGSQSVGPASVVDGFLQTWNRHDMTGLDRILTSDADWVTVSGARLRGGGAIETALTREHSTWAKSTTMTASGTSVRLLGSEAAVVSFDWEVAGATDAQGRAAAASRGVSVFVVVKTGDGWQIVSGQATMARSAR